MLDFKNYNNETQNDIVLNDQGNRQQEGGYVEDIIQDLKNQGAAVLSKIFTLGNELCSDESEIFIVLYRSKSNAPYGALIIS